MMVQAQQIKEHMDVVGSDGQRVGTVDHMAGSDRIKLAKHDAPDGKHHFIPLSMVASVDSHVHLKKSAKDAQKEWQSAA
jgi:hypothetical protein